jgi:MFS family permease
MKVDLAGPKNRGLAMGLNEFAGYFAVAASALATGLVAARYGLRPEPFFLGVGYVAVGLLLSAFAVRETHHHAALESAAVAFASVAASLLLTLIIVPAMGFPISRTIWLTSTVCPLALAWIASASTFWQSDRLKSAHRELARAHGGDLSLIATGPQGTTFRIDIPDREQAG